MVFYFLFFKKKMKHNLGWTVLCYTIQIVDVKLLVFRMDCIKESIPNPKSFPSQCYTPCIAPGCQTYPYLSIAYCELNRQSSSGESILFITINHCCNYLSFFSIYIRFCSVFGGGTERDDLYLFVPFFVHIVPFFVKIDLPIAYFKIFWVPTMES